MTRDQFPDALNGGEPQGAGDHRVGERLPSSPDITDVDPSHAEPPTDRRHADHRDTGERRRRDD